MIVLSNMNISISMIYIQFRIFYKINNKIGEDHEMKKWVKIGKVVSK